MAYNTTAAMDKLIFSDYVAFRKCENRFRQFSWSKNDSNYLDVKLKVFKKNDNKFSTWYKFLKSDSQTSRNAIEEYTIIVQRQGSSTQTGSEDCWRCGSGKQKDTPDYAAVNWWQKRKFIW